MTTDAFALPNLVAPAEAAPATRKMRARITRKRGMLAVKYFDCVLDMLRQLPGFADAPDRVIMETAGLGGATLNGFRRSGQGSIYAYYALCGLLSERRGDKVIVPRPAANEPVARSYDEAALLFDACRDAARAHPEQATAYKKLMAIYASDMTKLS